MKPFFFSIICCLFAGGLFAQNTSVTNVVVKLNEAQDKVTITYNLARQSQVPFYEVKVDISLDGEVLKSPVGLSGAVGKQVTPGLGKRIVWDALQDVSELSGQLKVKVTTGKINTGGASGPCTPIKTVPVLAGLGGVAVTGLGLLVGGLGQKGSSNELYDTYRDNTDPNAAIFATLSRDEHYADANSKHKQGNLLAIAGGATIAAGGFMLVSRLLKINKYNRQCQEGQPTTLTEPRWQLEPATASGPGIALIHRF